MRLTGAALVALFAVAAVVPAREPTKPELLLAVEKQLKAAHETAGPAVACVVVSRSDRYPKVPDSAEKPGKLGGYDIREFLKLNPTPGDGDIRLGRTLDLSDPKNIPDHGYACGVVIDAAGFVLTPYHVVEGATKVYVYLPGRGGSYADIHAADSRHDLAVLKLITPPANLTAIKFGEVRLDARNGQKPTVYSEKLVVLMANVFTTGFGVDKPTAALGKISAVRFRTNLDPTDGKKKLDSYYFFGPFLEHDAKLNSGVSGAALLNLDGEMIGLTTAAAVVGGGDRAPHYAFPADDSFRRVVDVLRRGEEVDYGYLGVTLFTPPGRPAPDVIQIDSVMKLGPAAQAGIEPGDVITQINGAPVTTYDDLLVHIGSALADAKVELTILRGGREYKKPLTLGKFPHKQPFIASVRPDPVFGLRVDYGSILAQSLSDARPLGNGVPTGVAVREIVPNSPAAAAFKKLGDRTERWLITHVNGVAVTTPAQFYKAAKGRDSVKLTVLDPTERDPKGREVTLP